MLYPVLYNIPYYEEMYWPVLSNAIYYVKSIVLIYKNSLLALLLNYIVQ